MPSDDDIAKLRHGRIVKARVYNSAGTDATEPHFGIMLDSDVDIREHDSFFLVMISCRAGARPNRPHRIRDLLLGAERTDASRGNCRGHFAEAYVGRNEIDSPDDP
jgi:hypothetical protein